MAPPPRGLSPTDLGAIRDALAAGRKPRILFTDAAGQIAGQAGHVIALTDPKASDEWIVVRFGRDELPFAVTDLALPKRGAKSPAESVAARTPNRTSTVPAPRPAPKATKPAPAQPEPSKPEPTPDPTPKAAPKPKPKSPATLVVTLSYAEREWRIAAHQGSRALAKPLAIKPTEALRMVAMIDLPGLHDAVEHIIAAEKTEAEQRAIRLRAELAEIESRLTELAKR